MSRADRRRRTRTTPRGPLPHTGRADRIAGARWAHRDAETFTFYTLPWPVWASALGLIAIGAWTLFAAHADRNWFGAAGVMFPALALWLIAKAPRERITLQSTAALLRIEEGYPWLRTRAEVPFAAIDGIALEYNRQAALYRVVALTPGRRLPLGRSFVDAHEARQRITALAAWMPSQAPPVDVRLTPGEDDDEDIEP